MVAVESLLEKVAQFLLECEQSQVKPTVLLINRTCLDVLKRSSIFSSRFNGDTYTDPRHGSIRVIKTEEDLLGAGLMFYENNPLFGEEFQC